MKEINIIPVDRLAGPPEIKKSGIITAHGSEMSLFIYRRRLMYLDASNCCVTDYFTKQEYAPIPDKKGTYFMQAFCDNDVVYAFATVNNLVYCFSTEDLNHWTEGKVVLEFPQNFELFNTSVCKDEHGYKMAIEAAAASDDPHPGRETERVSEPNPWIGEKFTEFFASADDIWHFNLLPFENSYTKERYNACPSFRYYNGYYYMICLEALPCYRFAPYIYRTADFETWEIGFYNPLFIPSREDLYPKEGVILPEEVKAAPFKYINTNNSDVDICEFEGKTYIVYCTGNQGITWGGVNCEAVYDGPLGEFLEANFS